jgi:anti-sigma factor RsiW
MADRNSPVTEDELHVYVDGELPADRREAVETWLANHPEDAARVASWRAQAEAIRSHFGAVIDEAVPPRLQIDRITRNRRSWAAIAAAVAFVAFVGGGIGGWMARGAAAGPSELETFASEALSAHRLYIGEVRHPIEVRAEENHLLPWLSRRVGTSLRAPDLTTFDLKLLGGRLLPGVNAPAALFMYESGSGERVTIYVSRTTEGRSSFRYKVSDKYGALRWSEGGYGWVVSGPDDKPRLKSIAITLYEQLDNRTPAAAPTSAPAPGAAPPAGRTSADQLISRRGS